MHGNDSIVSASPSDVIIWYDWVEISDDYLPESIPLFHITFKKHMSGCIFNIYSCVLLVRKMPSTDLVGTVQFMDPDGSTLDLNGHIWARAVAEPFPILVLLCLFSPAFGEATLPRTVSNAAI